MSNITINVDFLAGTEVKTAITEATGLARRMDVAYVNFDFNGVKFSIGQNCNVDAAYEEYTLGIINHICHS